MADIKLNKTELKRQKSILEQLTKYLPTLQLKKQQLQMEVDTATAAIDELNKKIEALQNDAGSLAPFLTEATGINVCELSAYKNVVTEMENIAGVDVPVFKSIEFLDVEYSLFMTPPWVDNAMTVLRELVKLREEKKTLIKKKSLLYEELRQTTIKVNLFEKRMIPQCKENIRVIKIFLGDLEIAAICNAKIAKGKLIQKAKKSREVTA